MSVRAVQDGGGNEIAPGATVVGTVCPEAFLFDFGAAQTPTEHPAPDSGDVWNNVTEGIGASSAGVLHNVVTVRNTQTDIDLVMVSRCNGANQNGTLASAAFPQNATRDSLYGNTETWGGASNVFPGFKLSGLDTALSYDFTFYASRLGVGDKRETGYTVEGGNSGFAALWTSRTTLTRSLQ